MERKLAFLENYRQQGWQLFPLHWRKGNGLCSCGRRDCKNTAKHPLTRHGHKDATTIPGQIEKWHKTWPRANWGAVTGTSTGFSVLDVDGAQGEESLSRYTVPDTAFVRTGSGGLHFYFRHPEDYDLRNSASKIAPGLDIRGQGGFIIIPPSIHKTGNPYRWVETPSRVGLAPFPKEFIEALKADDAKNGNGRHSSAPESPGEIVSGARNTTLLQVAGLLRSNGRSLPAIRGALMTLNQIECKPPLSTKEVERILWSVGKWEKGPRKVEGFEDEVGF